MVKKNCYQKIFKERQELAVKIKELDNWIERRNLPEAKLSTQGMQYLGATIEQLGAMKNCAKYLDERIKLLEG